MIHHIRGKLLSVSPTELVIDCSGLGIRAGVCDGERFRKFAGRKMILPAWLEYSPRRLRLYCFMDGTERDRFATLVSIPGIGPSTALRMLTHYEKLAAGIPAPHIAGLGPAKQARVARWLKRRGKAARAPELARDLREGLKSLGFDASKAAKAAEKALSAAPAAGLEELLRLAVKRGR